MRAINESVLNEVAPEVANEIKTLIGEAIQALKDLRLEDMDCLIEEALEKFREAVPGIDRLTTIH